MLKRIWRIPWPHAAAQGLQSCDEAASEQREAAGNLYCRHDAGRSSAEASGANASAGGSTLFTVRRWVRPSRAVQSIDWPAERPISAAPMGVRIEILPSAISASPGKTSVTRLSSPRSLVKRKVE